MTLNVCACAGRVATIVNAQTSVSAKAGSHRSLAKVNTECCTGFVIMIPFTECDRGRLLFARAPHFIPRHAGCPTDGHNCRKQPLAQPIRIEACLRGRQPSLPQMQPS